MEGLLYEHIRELNRFYSLLSSKIAIENPIKESVPERRNPGLHNGLFVHSQSTSLKDNPENVNPGAIYSDGLRSTFSIDAPRISKSDIATGVANNRIECDLLMHMQIEVSQYLNWLLKFGPAIALCSQYNVTATAR